jgi:hypothetical protein
MGGASSDSTTRITQPSRRYRKINTSFGHRLPRIGMLPVEHPAMRERGVSPNTP